MGSVKIGHSVPWNTEPNFIKKLMSNSLEKFVIARCTDRQSHMSLKCVTNETRILTLSTGLCFEL